MAKNGRRTHWFRPAYLLAAALTLPGSGCLVVAAGATGGAALTYVYFQGELSTEYRAALPDTWAATRQALTELGMPIVAEDWHEDHGSIESRTNHDKRVQISLKTQTSKIPAEGAVVRVGVRIGVFGDEAVSERILTQIDSHLVIPTANRDPHRPARTGAHPTGGGGRPPSSEPAPAFGPGSTFKTIK